MITYKEFQDCVVKDYPDAKQFVDDGMYAFQDREKYYQFSHPQTGIAYLYDKNGWSYNGGRGAAITGKGKTLKEAVEQEEKMYAEALDRM